MHSAPLCIIQARSHSTRLPGKMLRHLGGMTLIERAWWTACDAFSAEHTVVAIPAGDLDMRDELRRFAAHVFEWGGPVNDVLGRFYHCAHARRWHPESVIVRYTPDDPFKTVEGLRRVASGERLPVEIGGEAFTLGMLDAACKASDYLLDMRDMSGSKREHITYALFPTPSPPCPPGVWTIDTEADLAAARARLAEMAAGVDRGMY